MRSFGVAQDGFAGFLRSIRFARSGRNDNGALNNRKCSNTDFKKVKRQKMDTRFRGYDKVLCEKV